MQVQDDLDTCLQYSTVHTYIGIAICRDSVYTTRTALAFRGYAQGQPGSQARPGISRRDATSKRRPGRDKRACWRILTAKAHRERKREWMRCIQERRQHRQYTAVSTFEHTLSAPAIRLSAFMARPSYFYLHAGTRARLLKRKRHGQRSSVHSAMMHTAVPHPCPIPTRPHTVSPQLKNVDAPISMYVLCSYNDLPDRSTWHLAPFAFATPRRLLLHSQRFAPTHPRIHSRLVGPHGMPNP